MSDVRLIHATPLPENFEEQFGVDYYAVAVEPSRRLSNELLQAETQDVSTVKKAAAQKEKAILELMRSENFAAICRLQAQIVRTRHKDGKKIADAWEKMANDLQGGKKTDAELLRIYNTFSSSIRIPLAAARVDANGWGAIFNFENGTYASIKASSSDYGRAAERRLSAEFCHAVLTNAINQYEDYKQERDAHLNGNDLICAIQEGNSDEVTQLASVATININIVDINGMTPLMAAIHTGNVTMVKTLLENGADTSLKNKGGKTALQLALEMFDAAKAQNNPGTMYNTGQILKLFQEKQVEKSDTAIQKRLQEALAACNGLTAPQEVAVLPTIQLLKPQTDFEAQFGINYHTTAIIPGIELNNTLFSRKESDEQALRGETEQKRAQITAIMQSPNFVEICRLQARAARQKGNTAMAEAWEKLINDTRHPTRSITTYGAGPAVTIAPRTITFTEAQIREQALRTFMSAARPANNAPTFNSDGWGWFYNERGQTAQLEEIDSTTADTALGIDFCLRTFQEAERQYANMTAQRTKISLNNELIRAIRANDFTAVATVLGRTTEAGQRIVNVNIADSTGMTPLMAATRNGNVKMVQALLSAGANKDTKAKNKTALHFALDVFEAAEKQGNIGLSNAAGQMIQALEGTNLENDSEAQRRLTAAKATLEKRHAPPPPPAPVIKDVVEEAVPMSTEEPVPAPEPAPAAPVALGAELLALATVPQDFVALGTVGRDTILRETAANRQMQEVRLKQALARAREKQEELRAEKARRLARIDEEMGKLPEGDPKRARLTELRGNVDRAFIAADAQLEADIVIFNQSLSALSQQTQVTETSVAAPATGSGPQYYAAPGQAAIPVDQTGKGTPQQTTTETEPTTWYGRLWAWFKRNWGWVVGIIGIGLATWGGIAWYNRRQDKKDAKRAAQALANAGNSSTGNTGTSTGSDGSTFNETASAPTSETKGMVVTGTALAETTQVGNTSWGTNITYRDDTLLGGNGGSQNC